jgi:hypothetical protein
MIALRISDCGFRIFADESGVAAGGREKDRPWIS